MLLKFGTPTVRGPRETFVVLYIPKKIRRQARDRMKCNLANIWFGFAGQEGDA
jgi:hypothetical protein